jgi:hypothetical protein
MSSRVALTEHVFPVLSFHCQNVRATLGWTPEFEVFASSGRANSGYAAGCEPRASMRVAASLEAAVVLTRHTTRSRCSMHNARHLSGSPAPDPTPSLEDFLKGVVLTARVVT